jgi:MFS family permease/quinol monooxygenase YgiN
MANSAKRTTSPTELPVGDHSNKLTSAWAPLRIPLFRALWIASVASYIGTWMHDVGESWLMTSLTTSPVLVALVETAGSLPVVLVALPAGALADVVDRRRLLLVMQSWMCITAASMGVLTLIGQMTPSRLLLLTFLLGVGSAMNSPVWQAITPELVPSSDLPAAIALSGAGINIARAIGPALGGLIVAAAGPWAVFFLNAASFTAVAFVIYRWQPAPRKSQLPPEHFFGAMRAGTRYLRHSPELRRVLVRTGVFVISASALWALLAQQARRGLGLGSFGYGILLGCIGLGAVVGAWSLPKIRARLSTNNLVAAATIVFALTTVSLGYVRWFAVLVAALAVGGVAWIAVLASLNVSAQTVTPSWVRARVMAVYLLIFTGGLAVGSAIWGFVAARVGVPAALLFAAIGLLLGLTATQRYRLFGETDLSLTPSLHWPEPIVLIDPQLEEGPAITYVEYRIDPKDADEFLKAMKDMRRIRQRDGAIRWNLLRDAADPQRYIEVFVTESWGEHLRQHERVTAEDRAVERRAWAFYLGSEPPKITHLIAEEMPK